MTCAKRQVTCVIITMKGEVATGTNGCRNPQKTCPRSETDDYSKCRTICDQPGHAEIQALFNARVNGLDLHGATAYVWNHYWMCQSCGKALRDAGVTKIVIEERP